MKFWKILPFCFILFTSGLLAQDIPHYSLFEYSPLTLNPANTGAYNGTFRIGGIYRSQWFSGFDNFATPTFYIDAPIIRGIRKQDWIGVGLNFTSDNVGTVAYKQTGFHGSLAYHLALDKKQTNILTFGVQGGSVRREIDPGRVMFGDELRDGMTMENLGDNPSGSYFDLSAGILLSSQFNKQTSMRLGAAFKHLLGGNYSLLGQSPGGGGQNLDIPLRFTLHGGFDFALNKKWSLEPTFIYDQIEKANAIALQTWFGYKKTPEDVLELRFGAGYRLRDAAEVLLGVYYKDFKVAASYDVTLSSLNDYNNTVGGFELAVSYIGKIFKEPKIKPVIFCPAL